MRLCICTCVGVGVNVCFHCTKSVKQEGATSLLAKLCSHACFHRGITCKALATTHRCLSVSDLISWGWDLSTDSFFQLPDHYNMHPESPSGDLGQPPTQSPCTGLQSQPPSLHNIPLTHALAPLPLVLTLAVPQASASGVWHPLWPSPWQKNLKSSLENALKRNWTF